MSDLRVTGMRLSVVRTVGNGLSKQLFGPGMGATAAGYDGDGYLDIFKTNFSSDTNTLYRNIGDGTFNDATTRAGLAVQTRAT